MGRAKLIRLWTLCKTYNVLSLEAVVVEARSSDF
nr:MAG TPA: hypothetical protein [Caudoviricetes sp.]